jgi:hypothetical protein
MPGGNRPLYVWHYDFCISGRSLRVQSVRLSA